MQLPAGYSFRKLKQDDPSNDYLETLTVLTTVGEISTEMFTDLFNHWQSLPEIYQPHVITNEKGIIVATGMLFIERKAIHQCGKVGHIEDIAVAKSEQGKKLGFSMITGLTEVAKNKACYKVILDCSPHNVKFYEKCGYKNDGVEMVKRF
ncbi:Glucosamine 6-phosphate N-acetyltransferase [Debaryomyces fabryi]|uniref:Glucosamine 6-phosphate N-acetyltransferase n=1 Tax=Debaryomyces fabryi TaxID=58627 RepID=A0A0V1PYC1_9ASCO|nr:Glucosamine 6-phosphate N-acetyltransferase [Debaryomyces fabryi]KSA01174.1 Glucosamine 6-phosphate N-acetyltransferase [Debaryomyces fabryi]CUM49017.1 unnamed protein product [Debaryomyces fabryi]